MTVDQFMKTHQSEIKEIISELNYRFNSHDFIQKYSKVFETEYLRQLSMYSDNAHQKVHSQIGIHLSNHAVFYSIRKIGDIFDKNIFGELVEIAKWEKVLSLENDGIRVNTYCPLECNDINDLLLPFLKFFKRLFNNIETLTLNLVDLERGSKIEYLENNTSLEIYLALDMIPDAFEFSKDNEILKQIKNKLIELVQYDSHISRCEHNYIRLSYPEIPQLKNREAILCFGKNDPRNQIINNVIIGKIKRIHLAGFSNESHLPVKYEIINAEGEIKKYDVFELKKVITLD